jgi:hypothetical protein
MALAKKIDNPSGERTTRSTSHRKYYAENLNIAFGEEK